MRTILLSHNKTAYQKVMRAFETSDRTCVVHPTGTGKSYLIAAVSESFKKVLILGPNTFVLDQVHSVLKWRKRGVEYMTYQTLNLTENPHTDYDLICIDEFHRAGAPEWGAAVDRLLELNTEAKVFGTTATHIRYLDNERNMADELFHGNIASHITIAEAWTIYNILPIPRYVSGLFRWDKTVGEAQERIERSRSLSDKEKRERIFRLSNAKLRWELSYGMPTILKKHLDKDARRVIVFCGNIESLEQMRDEVVDWFREAGFTIASTCIMHSDLTDHEQRDQMDRFEDDTDGKGVKLMFSVNMLNEGIHVPNVNAVLMLRTTSSRIIYMQQMGRCLTTANTEKPLVLDMVDNITTTTAIKDIADEFDAIEIPQAEREGREPRKFEVKDYTLGVRDLIEKLVPGPVESVPFKERIAKATAFCEKHKRTPIPMDGKEDFLNWRLLREYYSDDQQVIALREKYMHTPISREEKIAKMQEYTSKHGSRPQSSDKENYPIWEFILYQCKNDPRVIEMVEKYGVKYLGLDGQIALMQKFTAKHGRRPMKSEKEEYRIWTQMLNKKSKDPRVIELKKKYGRTDLSKEEKILMMQKYTQEHGCRPPSSDEKLDRIWKTVLLVRNEDPRAMEMYKKFGKKTVSKEEKIILMQKFTAEHGRRPFPSEKTEYQYWVLMVHRSKSDPRVKEMREKYCRTTTNNI